MAAEAGELEAFCGIAVDALPPDRLVETIAHGIEEDRTVLLGNHNLHSLALLHQADDVFHGFFDLVDRSFVDGMSIVAVNRLCGGELTRADRATVLDWIWPLFDRAEQEQWSVFHLGSDGETIDNARAEIMARHPDLRLTTHSGFFDATPGSDDNERLLELLTAASPDVLLVGMGMPRQEAWIAHHVDRLPPSVVVTVGGIFGYLGSDRATPPRWAGALGLEWLARLVTEPRRLAHRYLVEPIPLVPTVARGVRNGRLGVSRWCR